jgi:GMP synthase-like glutamine amidotransferase
MVAKLVNPIAILEYDRGNGPAYFAEFLRNANAPYEHLRIDKGEAVPTSIAPYSGLCLMGGSPSVNDDLPWIGQVHKLTLDAILNDIPVIGHCFGGQLLCKALGGRVTASPEAEIGWATCHVEDNDVSRTWFGAVRSFPGFQWHFESFSIPANATRILRSANCTNQVFALGPHIGFQPHIEVDESVISLWTDKDRIMLNNLRGPGVQSYQQIFSDLGKQLPAMRAVAEHVYAVWLRGVLARQNPPT